MICEGSDFWWVDQDYPCRFGVAFPNWNGEVIVPEELLSFNRFAYSRSKRRLSFRVSGAKRKTFSTLLCTTDTNAKRFLKLFIEANAHISHTKIENYVFMDLDGNDDNLVTNLIRIKNGIETVIKKTADITTTAANYFIPIVIIGGALWIRKNRKDS
ncbi:MAG: hypothetical protein AAF518_14530 [Spirochaetota bacterium]